MAWNDNQKSATVPLDVPDSGVDCDLSSLDKNKSWFCYKKIGSATCIQQPFVPLEFLLTGGKITVNLFDRRKMEDGPKQNLKVRFLKKL